MTAHRLDRRLALLRAKRQGSFDRDQYYLEAANRARVARHVRVLVRRMSPVVLITPRWSQVRDFLDDVATDLRIGEPSVQCRTLSLAPLEGRTPHQAWNWIVQAITEFCFVRLEGSGAWRMVSRQGFRHTLRTLFDQAESGERRCLMIHGLEHMHVEALRDLIEVFEDHVHHREGPGRFNLLLAGSIDAPHFEFAGLTRLTLADFSEEEAVEALVEQRGPKELGRFRDLADAVGGIPAIVQAFGGESAESIGRVIADRRAVWGVLGELAQELRRAFDMVASDDAASDRLEALTTAPGPLPSLPVDDALLRAGLVQALHGRTRLRAPIIGDLARAD